MLPFVAVIAACVWALYAYRAELAEVGRGDGAVDGGALRQLDAISRRQQRLPRIAVFGDSLNMCTDPDSDRFDTIGRSLRQQLLMSGTSVEIADLSQAGLVPLYYYSLLDEVLAQNAALVVIEVNLRKFMDPLARPSEERLPGLARKLGIRESLTVVPSLEKEGLSLLDPPLMRLRERLGLLYVFEGARETGLAWVRDTGELARTTLGLEKRDKPSFAEVIRRASLRYAVDYTASHNAQVLRAMIGELRRAQVPFIAYVAPIDLADLHVEGSARDDVQRRIDDLQTYIGASPTEWLDLHDALPSSMFRDFDNHLVRSGCVRVARPIAQRVLHVISRSTRKAPTPAAAGSAPGR